MKNTLLPYRKIKRVFLFLLFYIALLQPQIISAQSTCSTTIPLGSHSVDLINQQGSGSELWFSFQPDSANAIINFENLSLPDSAWNTIQLFSGSCSSLTLLDLRNISPLLSPLINANNLVVGNNYFLKVISSDTTGGGYNLSIRYYDPNQIVSSCACPAPYNSPGNSCDLICNGGFETLQNNISHDGQLDLACPWYHSGGSSDLFSPQSSNASFSVPNNLFGTQLAHSGNNYAGFCPYIYPTGSQIIANTPDYKEYIMIKLKSPLQANQCYTFTCYVSLADGCLFASGNLGIYFSNTSPSQSNNSDYLPLPPQIVFSSIIANTSSWTQLNMTYTATGGEQFMTIGNFQPNAATPVTQLGPINFNHIQNYAAFSYYYIDDVSLEPCCNVMSTSVSPSSQICAPANFTLSASSPCTPATFTWAPSSQIIGPNGATVTANGSPGVNTFYCNMNLTNYGCTNTDTLLVQIDVPPVVNAGPDVVLCNKSPVTLTGTTPFILFPNFYTFGWSQAGGPVLCSQCTTLVVSPTVTTSYVFSVQDNHSGCPGLDTMTIFVYSSPIVHIVAPPNAITCDTTLHFSLTGVPVGASVHWASNAQIANGSHTPNFTAFWNTNTFSQDGIVTVTVTDIHGCIGYDTIIIPHCCCNNIYPIPSMQAVNDNVDSLLVHYPGRIVNVGINSIVTTQNLCINGVFTVNRNLDLKNVNVSMGSDAKINVLPGVTFTLEGIGNNLSQQTVVHACDRMWDGIYVAGTATLKVKDGTVIEDGKQAIVSVGGGVFQIQGGSGAGPVKMNKNLIAVWVKPFSGTYTGYIRNTIISCDAPAQPGSSAGITSPGQNLIAPYNTDIGYIGVRIDSVTNITIGDSAQNNYRNIFERTRYGVYATKSNVNTWNNTFKFIRSTYIPTHSNPTPDGIAVYATNKIFGPAHLLTVGRPGTQKATNRFQECSYGVMAENQMNMNCEYNKFDSCFTISVFSQNNTLRTILINADTLHDCTGINIDCYKNNNSTVTITNNSMNQTATVLANNFGQTGIYVANAMVATTHLLIQNNTIKKMRNGIWVSRVNNAKILDNGPITFIPGQPYTLANPATGIRIEQSVNVKVRNNKVKNTGVLTATMYDKMFGIYIVNCKNDTITQDSLINVGSGIFLKGNDNPSLLACNKMKNCIYGINFGFINNVNTAIPLNDQILYGSSQTPTSTGNAWSGNTFDLKGQIAFPGIHWYYNGYNPTTNLIAGSLIGSSTTSSSPDQCSSFIAPAPVNPIAQRNYLLRGICVTPRTYDTLSAEFIYDDQVYAYRTLRDNPSWLTLGTADDVYYQNFYSGYSSDPSFVNIVHLADAEDAIEAGDFSQAATDIATIRPKNVPEANRVTVIQVYLQSWALDILVLTDEQVAILTPIALQGPISGGIAVFDARNMLGIEVHDSSNLRLAQPQPIPNGISASHIYPNPTTGQVSIATDLPEGQNGTLNIYDLTGRRIASWQIIGGLSVYTFNASVLPSGTYIYQVSTIDKIIITDRLIMIKEEE